MDDTVLREALQRIQQARQSGANSLDLSWILLHNEQLAVLMAEIAQLTNLTTLNLQNNQLSSLPRELGGSPRLTTLDVTGNPLHPEVLAAAQESTHELLSFLRAVHNEGELIHEGKLMLVGEGEVGKSTLLAALRGEKFVKNRDTTHGIEIKPVGVAHDNIAIVLNGWDFGWQQIYRPTG